MYMGFLLEKKKGIWLVKNKLDIPLQFGSQLFLHSRFTVGFISQWPHSNHSGHSVYLSTQLLVGGLVAGGWVGVVPNVVKTLLWREWPSGLRCYIPKQKDPGSSPTSFSGGLWDPTSLRDSWWHSGRISVTHSIKRFSEPVPRRWSQVGRGAAK